VADGAVLAVAHDHRLYRLVRARHADALDTSYSRHSGGRWNPEDAFPVLYTACSIMVARGLARDLFASGLIEPEDLMPGEQPELVEIAWLGSVVDVASAAGVAAAGFAANYPHGVGHAVTQPKGLSWYDDGHEGAVCRSASLARLGFGDWSGRCTDFAETAIFADVCTVKPRQVQRRRFVDWY
jgi:RES domain-containing protein